jgi:hypothetical protein
LLHEERATLLQDERESFELLFDTLTTATTVKNNAAAESNAICNLDNLIVACICFSPF